MVPFPVKRKEAVIWEIAVDNEQTMQVVKAEIECMLLVGQFLGWGVLKRSHGNHIWYILQQFKGYSEADPRVNKDKLSMSRQEARAMVKRKYGIRLPSSYVITISPGCVLISFFFLQFQGSRQICL
jgi:hypothetical protein